MALARLAAVLLICVCSAAGAAPVLLISIDGLHPSYVLEADRHGLKIPTLRSFVSAGAFASGVIATTPTVTYPNHTTLITGVAPSVHGVSSNTTFDPLQINKEGWYWYAEGIRAKTLWRAAKEAGLRTASVNWPVTVGERDVDWLLPEYWRASTDDDAKLLRQLARPERLLETLEARLGPFVDGYMDTLESDRVRTRFAAALLREHKPQFMAVHLVALDGVQHREGPFVAPVFETLEALDQMIAELSKLALANDPATAIAIVSDHGFIATHTAVHLRTRFVDAGLITLKAPSSEHAAPTIEAWEAQLWSAGASAAIVLRDRSNRAIRARVEQMLDELQANPSVGIARVLDRTALNTLGAFPEADYLIEFAPGFYFGGELRGPLLTPASSKGTHGYLPDRAEMHAALFVKGAKTAAGRNLGVIDMRRIAPTLAQLLGATLPQASAEALPVLKQ